MKGSFFVIFILFFYSSTSAQSKFTGKLFFSTTRNDQPTDSFRLLITNKYIEKKWTFFKPNYPANRIVYIRDSGKIYHINDYLKRILWQEITDKPFSNLSLKDTIGEKDILGYACNSLTATEKTETFDATEETIYQQKWIARGLVADYGEIFSDLFKNIFGIFKNGTELGSKTIFEKKKDTSEIKSEAWQISPCDTNSDYKLPESYEMKEYKRETILEIIREQAEKKNPFLQ